MLTASASLLNIPVVILDVGAEAPAKQIVAPTTPDLAHIDGSFRDPPEIRELATKVDVLTVEIEHIDVDVLEEVEAQLEVHPAPSTIQTKFRQKVHLQSYSLPIAPFLNIAEPTIPAIKDAVAHLGLPFDAQKQDFSLRRARKFCSARSIAYSRGLRISQRAPTICGKVGALRQRGRDYGRAYCRRGDFLLSGRGDGS